MVFKGIIAKGGKVTVTLAAFGTNLHTATLSVGLDVDPGGNQNREVAPNGAATIRIKADQDAALVILYTFDSPAEGGRLEVLDKGVLLDQDDVSDNGGWTYSVE